jgi:hypothetical protein
MYNSAEENLSKKSFWLQSLFSAPLILSVLSKLNEKLDFSVIVEYIILKYDYVSKLIWGSIGNLFSIDLSLIHNLLTPTAIYLSLIFRSLLSESKEFPRRMDDPSLIDMISHTLILLLLIYPENKFSLIGIAFFYSIIVMFISAQFSYVKYQGKDDMVHMASPSGFLETLTLAFSVSMIIAFVSLIIPFSQGFSAQETWNLVVLVFISGMCLAIIFYATIVISPYSLFFTRILLFCIGIYLVDYVSNHLRPKIEMFLTQGGS